MRPSTSPLSMLWRPSAGSWLGYMLIATLVSGCASRAPSNDERALPLPECEAYALALRACAARLGAAATETVRAREGVVTAAVSLPRDADDKTREARRAECASATARIDTACR